ncbi:MAG: hypothetical protein ABIU96_09010 [Rhodanobacter sp.]
MNTCIRAMIAGFVATVVLSALMLLIPMPMAGAGLFAMMVGMMAPVMTLVVHLIRGAVLGVTYGGLGRATANA